MSSITLETIYKEIMDLKKKVNRLELLLTIPEVELPEEELEEIKKISKDVSKGNKILWKRSWHYSIIPKIILFL